jgi:hypothetical protein
MRSLLHKPSVGLLVSLVWLLIGAAYLACIISKAGDPPDGSPLYHALQPFAALAPGFGAVRVSAVLMPHWPHISLSQKAIALSTIFAAVTLCVWVFYRLWR